MSQQRISLAMLFTTAALSLRSAEFVPPPEQDRNQSGAFRAANIERPLRYWPQDRAFVITNGGEYFNRPLYSANAPFRADVGDQPELSLYLPGRGGNLRFGLHTPTGTKWLHQCQTVIARYHPGAMLYEIHDPALGMAPLLLTMLPLAQRDGVIVRVVAGNPPPGTDLIWAFGGVNGLRGRRSGDIGCETERSASFFNYARNNVIPINSRSPITCLWFKGGPPPSAARPPPARTTNSARPFTGPTSQRSSPALPQRIRCPSSLAGNPCKPTSRFTSRFIG